MPNSPSPTVLKRWIAFELRKLRENAAVTREQAANAVRGSEPGIGHFETGRSLPSALQLDKLLETYGVPERAEFFQRIRTQAKKGKDWWIKFDFTGEVLPEYFKLFLGLESCATSIESFDAQLVPGLLQTEAYAKAVVRGINPELPDDEVSRHVELRMARQRHALNRDGGAPAVWSVLHESALRLQVGGPDVLREQLEYLIDVTKEPTVTLQVLPMSAGVHTGVDGTFLFLQFPPELENDPGTVYVETRVKSYYYEQPAEISDYRAALRQLQVQACKPEETAAVLRGLLKEL